jgi:hypothetical protein
MQKTKCKKGDNPPGGGGMRGLVGIPLLFSGYNLYEECLMAFYRSKANKLTKNLIENGIRGKVGCLGWSRMLRIHEISAALPPICSLNLQKQQAKVEKCCPKVF